MFRPKTKEHLQYEIAQVNLSNKVSSFRPDLSPCPGDTFTLQEFSNTPAELVIVERDLKDVRRLRAVVLDDFPQVGSCDVESQLNQPGRIAHIRCDIGTWLDAEYFPLTNRTGVLPPDTLAEIQQKHQAVSSGQIQPTLHEEEVDGDPEYRRWKDENLRGAVARLESRAVRKQTSTTAADSKRRNISLRRSMQVAAVLPLLLFSAFSLRNLHEVQQEIFIQKKRVVQLEQAQIQWIANWEESQQRLRETESALSKSNRELIQKGQQLSENAQQFKSLTNQFEILQYATTAHNDAIEPNQSFVLLSFGNTKVRSAERPIYVSDDARWITLALEVVDAEPYESYSLQTINQQTNQRWSQDGLERRGGIVSLGVPASRLPLGDYTLFLSGHKKDGTVTPLDRKYILHVKRPRKSRG